MHALLGSFNNGNWFNKDQGGPSHRPQNQGPSLRSFGANTKKNPKEECKDVMTRGKKAIMIEGERRISDDQEVVAGEEED